MTHSEPLSLLAHQLLILTLVYWFLCAPSRVSPSKTSKKLIWYLVIMVFRTLERTRLRLWFWCYLSNKHVVWVERTKAALTHDSSLVQWSVHLPRLGPRHEVAQSNGAERDEGEVEAIQEGPGALHRAEHGRWRHKEAQHHQKQQQQEVDDGGRPGIHAWALQEADGSEYERVHEPLNAGGQHQHGEGNANESVDDGEGLPCVRQRSVVTITCKQMLGWRWKHVYWCKSWTHSRLEAEIIWLDILFLLEEKHRNMERGKWAFPHHKLCCWTDALSFHRFVQTVGFIPVLSVALEGLTNVDFIITALRIFSLPADHAHAHWRVSRLYGNLLASFLVFSWVHSIRAATWEQKGKNGKCV